MGITVLLGVSAVNTANNLLYLVVSSLLSFMLISGFLSRLNLSSLKVELIPPQEVFAQRKTPFKVQITNQKFLPSFLLKLSSEVDEKLIPIVKDRAQTNLSFYFKRRGKVDELKLLIYSDFPLGLFRRERELLVKVSFYVFPRPLKASLLEVGVEGSGKQEGGRESYGYEEFKGVREYSGEPIKRIHWKATAKLNKLMVKETYSKETGTIILKEENLRGDKEEKISKLTYLTLKLLEQNYAVGLKAFGSFIRPSRGIKQKLKILTFLSKV